jgi:ankyrin repeat protein
MESVTECLLINRMNGPVAVVPPDIDRLTEAAVNGDLEEIHEILSHHRDNEFFLDENDSQGHTPLTAVLFRGSAKSEEELPSQLQDSVLEELYRLGANFDVPDRHGVTPLFASLYADLDSILTVARYADLTQRLDDGRTFVMTAAAMGLVEVLEMFETDLNLNDRDNDGNTILHHAVSGGNFFPTRSTRESPSTVIEFLCEQGVDTSIQNNAGETAFELALNHNLYDVALAIFHCDLPKEGFREILIKMGETVHGMRVHIQDTVLQVKQAFFGPNYRNYELLFPTFRLSGRPTRPEDKLMADDRALSDYNIQDYDTLVAQVKLRSGVRGGKRQKTRRFQKTRRHRKN